MMSIFPKEKSGALIELGMIIVIWIKSRKSFIYYTITKKIPLNKFQIRVVKIPKLKKEKCSSKTCL
jgi:hypothetical protein